ncbi:Panacea domain-containing protein [Methylobacterium brachiatum]|uniref:Panacea domain-containing protein n=1 Tax=Methylobacterium brachiatum TaxID=269660 RepID=UPI0013CE89D4|nr:Panacea domain-containing protein [Methylobacterium brachiatum]
MVHARLTQYDIVKSLFVADRAHLNRFGRPITYDNYVAMKHGPVPSLAYDFLKGNGKALSTYGLSSLPWTRASAEYRGSGCYIFTDATTVDEEAVLSQSDMAALDTALHAIINLSFGQVRKLTHSDPAYKEAWAAVGEGGSNPMSLGLLFDEPNFEAAKVVEFTSKQSSARESSDDEFAIPADLGRRKRSRAG